ncbi:Glycosyl-phosphatidyl inositol-anchored, plant [Corchorus olitorius]|uniref:Glycosyl-phosphatidyl inositol-anchored, plant n=1 Tax=Corchorus olitorius TaxID=93759 RepID=A0A1R3IBC7_9ROSI|nr:Glycosyl-phosphatidyl inositol-anchored, plant [Corchorus olitorius]
MMSLIFASAYGLLDPNENINIKWDIMSWTPDGYVAMVTISNLRMYRQIMSPGWTLGCNKSPSIVDLLHGVPPNQQVRGCYKGSLLGSSGQNRAAAVSSFQITVGHSGTSKKSVKVPKNFYFLGPKPGYSCSAAVMVPPSIYFSANSRRKTRAMNSVFFKSFSINGILALPWSLVFNVVSSASLAPKIQTFIENGDTQLLQCTKHMCPIQVHWHVKVNYWKYWRVKMNITYFYYHMNYSHWNLVVQHPNLNNVIQVDNFTYKLLFYQSTDDSGVFYGVKDQNELLMGDRASGNVQSTLIFEKDESTFTLEQGWAFPRKVYFNGDECMMPPPDTYPFLPNCPSPIAPSQFAVALLFIWLAFLPSCVV